MSLKVGIVGAGWYGSHIGLSLASLGCAVQIFDRNERVLGEASGNNQFRLHLGFHYARHHATRLQSRDGFQRFLERYPNLSAAVPENYYAVPKQASLVDFQTYKMIMAATGIDFVEELEPPPELINVEGCLRVHERVILLEKARHLFSTQLKSSLNLGREVKSIKSCGSYAEIDGERFDYVIDATWGQHRPLPIDVYFEPTILLYYERLQPFPAITLVDGQLCSIYPTEDADIVTLSSVQHTPLAQCSSAHEAQDVRAGVDSNLVAQKRTAMESQISANVPGFREAFRFAGIQLAIKTKPVGQSDDRSCCVFQDGAIFSVMSGKIDTIFYATERILSMIEADRSIMRPAMSGQSFRDNIVKLSA